MKTSLTEKEIKVLLRQGKRVYSPEISLTYSKSEEKRMAVILSKKVIKTAVERNKIRRVIREIMKNKKENNFIFVVKKDITKKSFEEINNMIQSLISKVN